MSGFVGPRVCRDIQPKTLIGIAQERGYRPVTCLPPLAEDIAAILHFHEHLEPARERLKARVDPAMRCREEESPGATHPAALLLIRRMRRLDQASEPYCGTDAFLWCVVAVRIERDLALGQSPAKLVESWEPLPIQDRAIERRGPLAPPPRMIERR